MWASGNGGYGLTLAGSTGTSVTNSQFGLAVDGVSKAPNLLSGIRIQASQQTTIGAPGRFARVVASGNTENGIDADAGSQGLRVMNTYVGVSADGMSLVGNGLNGIFTAGSDTEIGAATEDAVVIIGSEGAAG